MLQASQNKVLSIIIPAYNEENSITKILEKLRTVELCDGIGKELVIVNDCSRDNTEARVFEFQGEKLQGRYKKQRKYYCNQDK